MYILFGIVERFFQIFSGIFQVFFRFFPVFSGFFNLLLIGREIRWESNLGLFDYRAKALPAELPVRPRR